MTLSPRCRLACHCECRSSPGVYACVRALCSECICPSLCACLFALCVFVCGSACLVACCSLSACLFATLPPVCHPACGPCALMFYVYVLHRSLSLCLSSSPVLFASCANYLSVVFVLSLVEVAPSVWLSAGQSVCPLVSALFCMSVCIGGGLTGRLPIGLVMSLFTRSFLRKIII